ncbi:hypothetical protein SAMN05444166_0300 [Singulisphaera sp. GP187]|uniref:hypothetical protein n=1 Tax=Singulisphaera sp. GP187 TaxID=1882752 RepID=UPI000926746E|nr:hypothetical protein [Singulisphaera sp. GP187]SIN70859.1 hypothetical protein SAMN05444166_0300 [Singulisphaera sp. GP187]
MNIGTLLELFMATLAKAQAFAALHRVLLVPAAELTGILLLLWGVIDRPRTCIVIAVAAYLLYRYGPNWGHAKGE